MKFINYSRIVEGILHDVEVDGDGRADIEYTVYGCGYTNREVISLDFADLEAIYLTARAHRDAYQAYHERDFENPEQYDLDFENNMKRAK